ncbi:MAG: hypothetical protein E7620_02340 [Ruminococcaceae bacterium]|nr:hypothetical protein [Oscillospiraceae bacterium]
MRYYAVADVHSFCDQLLQALREAGFFEDRGPKKLVLCGDALDRGDQTAETVRFLLELQEKDELIYILGNHEDLLVTALQEIARGDVAQVSSGYHVRNGTWGTILQLAEMSKEEGMRFPRELVQRVMQSDYYTRLLPATVDWFETSGHIFLHGWMPTFVDVRDGNQSYTADPDWRNAELARWRNARWLNGMELACCHGILEQGKTVICGHFHARLGHINLGRLSGTVDTPFAAEGILNIDGAVALGGRINCVVVDA